jgi:hypothetical protein
MRTVESRTSRPTSAGPTGVAVTLRPDPRCWVRVPIVHSVREGSECRLDVIPAPFIVQATLNEFGDERTPLSGADSTIQLSHQLVLQHYVHTHVLSLAHNRPVTRYRHSADMNMTGRGTIYGERIEDLLPGLRTIRDATTIGPDGMHRATFTLTSEDGAPLKRALMRVEAELLRDDADAVGCRRFQVRTEGQRAADAFVRLVQAVGDRTAGSRRPQPRTSGPRNGAQVKKARSEGFEPPTF